MGADFWQEFTPYRKDLNRAMKELQETVLKNGSFRKSEDLSNFNKKKEKEIESIQNEMAIMEKEEDETIRESVLDECRMRIDYLHSLKDANTLEEKRKLALFLCEADGTCSILDFDGFSDTFNYGKITPVNNNQLLKIFNTDKPNHQQVIDKSGEIAELCDRFQGVCITIYEDGKPDEVYFAGYSAD